MNKKIALTGDRKKSILQAVGENLPRQGEVYALFEVGDE